MPGSRHRDHSFITRAAPSSGTSRAMSESRLTIALASRWNTDVLPSLIVMTNLDADARVVHPIRCTRRNSYSLSGTLTKDHPLVPQKQYPVEPDQSRRKLEEHVISGEGEFEVGALESASADRSPQIVFMYFRFCF